MPNETAARPTPDPAKPPVPSAEPWVRVALLVRPQGRKGELLAEILTDFPERFAERRQLFLRPPHAPQATPEPIALQEHWLHGGRVVLKFAGVDDMDRAEQLRGYEVLIPRAARAPLEEGAVYIGDLIGCEFFDTASGTPVGVIVDVDRESTNLPLIVVQPPGKRAEVLIPFANAYAPSIDLHSRRMTMALPEGLLSLDAPLTPEERSEGAADRGDASAGRTDSSPSGSEQTLAAAGAMARPGNAATPGAGVTNPPSRRHSRSGTRKRP